MKKDQIGEENKEHEGEKASRALNRRLNILTMFSRKNQELTTQEIAKKLHKDGDDMAPTLVLRTLKQLEKAGFMEVVEDEEKKAKTQKKGKQQDQEEDEIYWTGKWRWPMGFDSRIKLFPKFSIGEIIGFRLMELLLKPLLPKESYHALLPYLNAARSQCEIMPKWDTTNTWERKVRVVPPTQPLLPPEPHPALLATMSREQWQSNQEAIRDAILEGLFRNQQCEIEYQQLWRDEPAHWTIHPLVYLQRGPAFYLLCMINDFTDVRQLALHRMVSAKVLDDAARKPTAFNVDWIDREVERSQGMGGSGEPIRLVTRFWKYAGSHLMETRLSADQIVDSDDDNHFRLTATVNDTAQLRWWLLSFGSKVEVLEPENLRGEMAQNGYWMNRMYSTPKAPPATATPDSESKANG